MKTTLTTDKKTGEQTLKIEIPLAADPNITDKGNAVVVTTHGFKPTTIEINGEPLKLNVTGIIKATQTA